MMSTDQVRQKLEDLRGRVLSDEPYDREEMLIDIDTLLAGLAKKTTPERKVHLATEGGKHRATPTACGGAHNLQSLLTTTETEKVTCRQCLKVAGVDP